MPRIQVSIQHFPVYIAVVFIDPATQRKIGRIYNFATEELVFQMLARARASLETRNLVESALAEQRCCTIFLDLTAEQFAKLSRP